MFVTNTERLAKGSSSPVIPSSLSSIKSALLRPWRLSLAHKAGYTAISSHRSGETEDTTIADLAALNTCHQRGCAAANAAGTTSCCALRRSWQRCRLSRLFRLWIADARQRCPQASSAGFKAPAPRTG
ncbi:MAG: hypothetical protein ACLSB9_13435 [Hydrogeniiclostridium mannosilyticum]